MTSPKEDQFIAAVKESQYNFLDLASLMDDATLRINQAVTSESRELFSKYSPLSTGTCRHLSRTPEQPWILQIPLKRWNCRECLSRTPAYVMRQLSQSRNCDWCDRWVYISQNFYPISMQYQIYMIAMDVCERCKNHFDQH